MAARVKSATPHVTGIMVKALDGHTWQGHLDNGPDDMRVTGPVAIKRWHDGLAAVGLDLHLWAVARGRFWQVEAKMLIMAANVAGVKSLTLDVEEGRYYWGIDTAGDTGSVAASLSQMLRSNTDTHLSLCMDFRDNKPDSLAIDEWLPNVDSLQPMCYWPDFSAGTRGPENDRDGVRVILGYARAYSSTHKLVAMLQTSPYAVRDKRMPVKPVQVQCAIGIAVQDEQVPVSLFRYGGLGSSDAMCKAITEECEEILGSAE